ncbi:hypothetical protein BpHYR1_045840 [Brachionus plicatilis]|uniref:Uncharacterized protein n=1 Tax=Brachionus plicatilis TaxID=10195 RepID=A0A3M7RR31_BRAPC|nr:hypothetical protein BpHYR1_045840 [Brachionus plicatilis]
MQTKLITNTKVMCKYVPYSGQYNLQSYQSTKKIGKKNRQEKSFMKSITLISSRSFELKASNLFCLFRADCHSRDTHFC